jgi:hypothetical protein
LMPEIAVAIAAVVLGDAQVQNHDLITLTGVLQGTTVGGLNANEVARTINARRTSSGLGPDVNPQFAVHVLNG